MVAIQPPSADDDLAEDVLGEAWAAQLAAGWEILLQAVVLAVLTLVAARVLMGWIAQLAAWVDSGFAPPGPVTTGSEGMLHRRGVTSTPLEPAGKVRVRGELWHAVASEPMAAGQEIEIIAVHGLTLEVAPPRNLRNETTVSSGGG